MSYPQPNFICHLSSLHRLATDFQFILDQYRVLTKCPCKTHKAYFQDDYHDDGRGSISGIWRQLTNVLWFLIPASSPWTHHMLASTRTIWMASGHETQVHKYQEAFTEGVIALGHQRKRDTLDITNLGGTWESLMRFKQPSKQSRKGSHIADALQKIRPCELKCMQLEDADIPLRDLSPNHLNMISAVSPWFPMILGLESEVTTQATYKGHKWLKVLQTPPKQSLWIGIASATPQLV